MYGRLNSVIISPSNSEHDECLDDNHELHRYIFDSMNSPYWDGLAAQYNTTCFTLDCAAIVGFTNYLPWRLYKRPKFMNYHKLVGSRWICNATRPWPGAAYFLPRLHRSARAMSQILCHLVSLHHHDPRFYRANAYSMAPCSDRHNRTHDVTAV